MIKKIREAFDSSTLRQSGVTFGGTVVNGALGAVFYILCARALGPAAFGLMSVALAVSMLASSIADFGTETGLVRFVSHAINTDKVRAYKFLKLTFKIKIVAGVSVSILGALLAPLIASLVFKKPELTIPLRIAFVTVFTTIIFGFVVATLKAFQKFFLWSAIQVGANFVRVGIILSLFVLGAITVESAVWTYAFTLLAGFIIGIIFLIPKEFLRVKNENSVARELFHYNKWIAVFGLVSALSSRVDTFITARYLIPTDIGLYAAANQLVYIVPQIIGALGTVIAPKMSGMNAGKIVTYLKKTQLLVLGLAFLGLLSIPVVGLFVPLIYGSEYVAAIPVFAVLLLSMLVFLIAVPVHNAVIYYFSYPKLFFYLSLGHLGIMLTLGFILIPRYGMIGAASAVLAGSLFNFIIPSLWVYRKLKSTGTLS